MAHACRYNYIATSLGEGPAWVATACLLFEYVLSNAAVIRGFAPYFAVLVGKVGHAYACALWSAHSLCMVRVQTILLWHGLQAAYDYNVNAHAPLAAGFMNTSVPPYTCLYTSMQSSDFFYVVTSSGLVLDW